MRLRYPVDAGTGARGTCAHSRTKTIDYRDERTAKTMSTTFRRMTAFLPAVALLLCSSAALAIDATDFTISCDTFLKGTAKFKPALTDTQCRQGESEVISVEGTVTSCTVGGGAPATFKIASGAVKGRITAPDCTCNIGLGPGFHPVTSGTLSVKWKVAEGSDPIDDKTSVLTFSPGTQIDINLLSPGGVFTGTYGVVALTGGDTGVTGSFQGTDGGMGSSLAGVTAESVNLLFERCQDPDGLEKVTFAFLNLVLQ